MRLRNLLLATGAIVAAGAMALAPAAQATTPGTAIATVSVGGSVANVTHPINLTMKSAQAKLNVFGLPLTINCTAGTASGFVNGGTLGQPSPEMVLNAMSLTCPSIIPGTTVTMNVTCNINTDFNDLVHTGLTDTGTVATNKFHRVAGTMPFNNCVLVTISYGCTHTINGFSTVYFDEAVKTVGGVNYQDLYLTGSTVTVANVVTCMGSVTNGQAITINVAFNVQSPDGLIDFQ